jgi:hypothetical protein
MMENPTKMQCKNDITALDITLFVVFVVRKTSGAT